MKQIIYHFVIIFCHTGSIISNLQKQDRQLPPQKDDKAVRQEIISLILANLDQDHQNLRAKIETLQKKK